MSRADKLDLLAVLSEKARRAEVYRYKTMFKGLYDWQEEFITLTKEFSAVCLCAANRIGKTYTGTYIDAIHLMGHYPDEWKGYEFDKPILAWLLGYSGEKTRDLLQQELFGRISQGKLLGGLIPPELIVDYKAMSGTSGALREVRVRHSSGGISVCQFWSYSQGQHALMGDSVDWYHVDEEPRDQSIYPQVLTRTATGDQGRGGRGILTFTPENGRTELVVKFMDEPGKSQYFMQKGWDDAPHLSEEIKESLLESFPVHQRDMRTKGTPMLGHGRIYDVSESFITCDSFDIPKHFYVINGLDFGWDHPQSHIQLAWDRDQDIFYITRALKVRQTSPDEAWGSVKQWAADVPTSWPLDGLQTEKGSGKQQKEYYEEAGFNMLDERATWEDGSNGVEAGLYEIRDLMRKGKFKIFAGLRDVFDEILQYHRDDRGKIVKKRDDLLDAIRYAYMMRREAIPFGDILNGTTQDINFDSEW
ncbi:MAG: DNA packaging protein [Pseudoalteromonas sp.]|nr:DNA packaging protein [Pseudoalteromonas sp.]